MTHLEIDQHQMLAAANTLTDAGNIAVSPIRFGGTHDFSAALTSALTSFWTELSGTMNLIAHACFTEAQNVINVLEAHEDLEANVAAAVSQFDQKMYTEQLGRLP